MNGATVARCPAASTNPETPTTRLFYRMVLLFIMQPMAKDWEDMIFCHSLQHKYGLLSDAGKCGNAVQFTL